MYMRFYLNNNWLFSPAFTEDIVNPLASVEGMEQVRIPHTVKEMPYNYFDEGIYQMLSAYRKSIFIEKKYENKRILLTFGAVAHVAKLYINGEYVMSHNSGYTAFTADITDYVRFDAENIILLSVDSREDKINVPPFGKVIDYMTYGGIYRDVYLDIKNPVYIKNNFLYSTFESDRIILNTELEVETLRESVTARQFIETEDGEVELSIETDKIKDGKLCFKCVVPKMIKRWDVESPKLYNIRTEIFENNILCDESLVKFGFREAVFKKDGFYLNGKKLKIRGLDRHQCYPYAGYAMPKSMQVMDADILKYELSLNAVRTSHYPDSHDFIGRCDEIGLLVFTEMPGWQHIGDKEWQDVACENVKEMVTEYRNHPSIILWGVRINESVDCDDFYMRTNEIAHSLDKTRQTGGVRNFKKSHLFEDVYTYNDFSHNGKTPGCEPKKNVTSDMEKGYLITEYNGHMYPTKAFDQEDRRLEHALRHARVLDAVAKETDIAGSFGWCMADYNTHRDFGSGDRICYHGVLDMFRNEKMASYVYSSQGDDDFLEISSTMDIGEHPECNRGETYIFTNADEVNVYKDDVKITTYKKSQTPFKNLKHGPIPINDFVGDALLNEKDFSHKTREDVKKVLNAYAMYGFGGMPKKVMLTAAKLMFIKHISMERAIGLYTKYVGNWGEKAPVYKYEAVKAGKIVKTCVKTITEGPALRVSPSNDSFYIDKTYDVVALRIKAVDEYGNVLPFFNEPITISVSGPVELIGPNITTLRGGMGGTYLRTLPDAKEGDSAVVTIINAQTETVRLEFMIHKEEVKEL
ncbi:MAG: glycoside hydrolase family 2 protein [Lachnospiraceae bacterium]|nr:glycoside hydrolase family 2 protein [Lachnospiraceae bacterium]